MYFVYRRWSSCTYSLASLVYVLYIERFSKNWAEGTCEVNNDRRILHVVTQPYVINNPTLQVSAIYWD